MLNFLKDWIINIVTISLILILFEILMPTGKIKKIINLVSGFILLIVIINPFLTLKNQNYSLSDTVISDSYYIDKKELENSSKLFKDIQMKQIADVYKNSLTKKIKEQTKELEDVETLNVDVEINEDYSSNDFGAINKVCIELRKVEQQEKEKTADSRIKPVMSVKKVDINDINVEKENKNEKSKSLKSVEVKDKELTELVKDYLNKSLEIPKDCIVVTVLEE